MRATINFETNVDEIFSVMFSLIELEAERLHNAAYALDEASPTDVISLLDGAVKDARLASVQLQQYRDMLVSFEKARFETILPQPADDMGLVASNKDLKKSIDNMAKFDAFVDKMREEPTDDSES